MDVHAVVVLTICDALTRARESSTNQKVVGALFGVVDKATGRPEALHAVQLKALAAEYVVEQEELLKGVDPQQNFLGVFCVTDSDDPEEAVGASIRSLVTELPPLALLVRVPQNGTAPKPEHKPLNTWSFSGGTWSPVAVRVLAGEAERVALNEVLPGQTESEDMTAYRDSIHRKRIATLQNYLAKVEAGQVPNDDRLVAKVVHVIKRARAPIDHLPEESARLAIDEQIAIAEALAVVVLKGDETFVQRSSKAFNGRNRHKPSPGVNRFT